MGSFTLAVQVLTNHVLCGLQQDVQREQYNIFHAAVSSHFGLMVAADIFGADVGPLHTWTPGAFAAVRTVLCQMGVRFLVGNTNEGEEGHIRTWADVANVLGNALATQLGNHDDEFMFFRVAMFVRHLRSQLSAPPTEVRQRQNELAKDMMLFVLTELTYGEDNIVGVEVEEVVVELDIDEEGDAVPEAQPDVVTDEEGDAVPEAQPDVVTDEEGDAVPEAQPDVVTDEEGDAVSEAQPDVVMETKGESEGSGSRRRRRDSSYEEELTRERNAKRRYNLRDTRVRRERMEMLKENDSKRKVAGGTGGSLGGSRKRSRR